MAGEMVHKVGERLYAQFLLQEFGLGGADSLDEFYVEIVDGVHLICVARSSGEGGAQLSVGERWIIRW